MDFQDLSDIEKALASLREIEFQKAMAKWWRAHPHVRMSADFPGVLDPLTMSREERNEVRAICYLAEG